MEPWKWALIGVGIALFLSISAGVMYYVCIKKTPVHDKNMIEKTCTDEERQPIDEGIVSGSIHSDPNNNNSNSVKSSDLAAAAAYGQQFALVNQAQTVLSPPRVHHQKTYDLPVNRKESPTLIAHEQQRNVFSLSPLHANMNGSPVSSDRENNNNSICSNSTTTHRTITPFQGHTLNQIWRGPTPPWTQYPGRG